MLDPLRTAAGEDQRTLKTEEPVIAERASRFQEEILIELIDSPEPDNEPADASSTLMLMALGAGYGDEVAITSTNAVAVEQIAQLIAQDLSD
ncbi:HPr family phosphocarrier protein [Corynebacterium amycolatum]|uniref:HPr family phosphocarrier protein n=1 Tax=Corynebacterium amycolatum TaxID=43765 RepID=UPI001F2884AB|nr:HPr family phosphocarrier protein [Corynebacterium amycolatum]